MCTRSTGTRGSRSRSGMTLVECVAAVVIMALAIPPAFVAVRAAATGQADPILITRARWLAMEKLEDVIADRHSTTRGYGWVATGQYAAENPVSGTTGFTRAVTVAETDASLSGAGTGYKTVTVTVGWTSALGSAKTLSIATVLTDY